MPEELDINKLVVGFAQANLERLVGLAGSELVVARNQVRARLRSTYKTYLTRLLERHSKAKSFFIRSEPTPLYDFFVPLSLSTQNRHLDKASTADLMAVSPRSVITGSGGCGKSVFMRHLLIGCFEAGSKVPVFVELRQVNGDKCTLRSALLAALQGYGLDIDDAYFELALEAGHFCFLLDGFDELDLNLRKPIAKQIDKLMMRYPANWIIVTSRPDSELNALDDFVHFAVEPLDLEGAVYLVEKLPFESAIKTKFVEDLRKQLFQKHRSFLSNPLLLSIMVLTYTDIAHIPDKLSLFYNQAYESLFQKHDALKGGFQRQRRTQLDIQDFASAFSAFCVQSYDKRDFAFSRMAAIKYFDDGKRLSQLEYDSEDLLQDSLQAVCLLLEDGLDIAFAHRSFQEFFAARFIAACSSDAQERLIKRFAKGGQADAVMDLLFELDPQAVENYYIIPGLQDLKESIGFKRQVGITHYLRYIKRLSEVILLRTGKSESKSWAYGISDVGLYYLMTFVARHYLPAGLCELSKEDRISWEQQSHAALQPLADKHARVQIGRLTINSEATRALARGEDVWSIELLRAAIAQQPQIERRHRHARQSITQLLG